MTHSSRFTFVLACLFWAVFSFNQTVSAEPMREDEFGAIMKGLSSQAAQKSADGGDTLLLTTLAKNSISLHRFTELTREIAAVAIVVRYKTIKAALRDDASQPVKDAMDGIISVQEERLTEIYSKFPDAAERRKATEKLVNEHLDEIEQSLFPILQGAPRISVAENDDGETRQ